MSRRTFRLVHSQARQNAIDCVREAPEGYEVIVREPTRSLDQNAGFHAICTELAKSRIPWAGRPRHVDEWKQLLVSGHSVATAKNRATPEVTEGLEGEVIQLRESTASMSKSRSSSLIQYAEAFLAMHVEEA